MATEAANPPRAGGEAKRKDRMMDGNFSIGRLGGVEVRLHWSLIAVFALIVWSLAALLPHATNGERRYAPPWLPAISTLRHGSPVSPGCWCRCDHRPIRGRRSWPPSSPCNWLAEGPIVPSHR